MSSTAVSPASKVKVRRSTRVSWISGGIAVPVLVLLAALPYLTTRGTQQNLVTLFSLIVLGTMWNLLAGYGGMVSIGQQAYIGIGAYGLVYLADEVGVNPFLAVPVAALIAAAMSLPISFLAFRLSGGYFAIGTWVIAEVVKLVTLQLDTLGLGLTSIRDDAVAAASLGVRVTRSRRIVYVVAAAGTAAAGATIAANSLRVQPESIYSVQYAAFMLFIVVIGGIGTIEGPIIGAILFYVVQQQLADLGTWYLVILGAIAIAVVLFLPGGIWGLLSGRGRLRLFPVGYHLVRAPSGPGAPTPKE